MLTFPITFLLGDVINEYYGATATKNTVYLGLVMSILVFIIVNIAQALPYLDKAFNVTPEAFNMIFGSAKLMYIASIVAYLVGQLLDIWLFGIIKRVTRGRCVCIVCLYVCICNVYVYFILLLIYFDPIIYSYSICIFTRYIYGRYLWLRATGSTVLSQMMDSFVVSYIAFRYASFVTYTHLLLHICHTHVYKPTLCHSHRLEYIHIHTYFITCIYSYTHVCIPIIQIWQAGDQPDARHHGRSGRNIGHGLWTKIRHCRYVYTKL